MAIKDNMESIKDKAMTATQAAAQAAKLLALISKKKVAIASEQEKIRRAYTQLGKICYKDYVTDEEADEAEYLPIFDKITDSYRRVNTLREEIASARDAYEEAREAKEEDASEAVALEAPDFEVGENPATE